MRARFIYEFERGLEPKTALGIGPRIFKIRKCFRDLDIPDKKYKITPTEVIFNSNLYLEYKNVTWLPNNLEINGNLYLRNTPITELPDGLKVGDTLDLENTLITKLPDDLQVGLYIWVIPRQTKLIIFIQNSIFKDKLKIGE
jgi:hypothetical protein